MSAPLAELLAPHRTITVVGRAKNAGKTTVINHLLERMHGRVGLASLGLDGEARDQLTGLPKPRVRPPPDALVAAMGLVDIGAVRVVERLPYRTAVGSLVVVEPPAGTPVVVSGPTRLDELDATVEALMPPVPSACCWRARLDVSAPPRRAGRRRWCWPPRGRRSVAEVVPYGDARGDGMVQLSFTLPVPADARAREIGLQLLRNNGLSESQVVHITAADGDMTFYVAYARAGAGVDPDQVTVSEVEAPPLGFDEINALIECELGRRMVVIGAAIESDAHTIGIDAIMNMKGFAGDYGLERYPWVEAVNPGAQLRLVREAQERQADAILVSQVVTQRQVHARQLTKLVDLLEAEGLRDRYLLVAGGPRLSNAFAEELGYDAGAAALLLPGRSTSTGVPAKWQSLGLPSGTPEPAGSHAVSCALDRTGGVRHGGTERRAADAPVGR